MGRRIIPENLGQNLARNDDALATKQVLLTADQVSFMRRMNDGRHLHEVGTAERLLGWSLMKSWLCRRKKIGH